jgi:hypothetical protein
VRLNFRRSEWRPAQDGQLAFAINGHQLKVRIWEKGRRPKPYDSGATGELNIEALAWSNGRQSSWGDRKRWRLEDRLPQLMRELEAQAAEAEERRLAKEREEAERQRQWELAMEHAKRRLVEDHRVDVLRKRVRAWHEAEAIRAYCDAVEARHGTEATTDAEAAEWLAFAREYADLAQRLPRMPGDPETTHEALKPYLGRWSPYGPQRW